MKVGPYVLKYPPGGGGVLESIPLSGGLACVHLANLPSGAYEGHLYNFKVFSSKLA